MESASLDPSTSSQDDKVEKRVFGGHPSPDWVNELPSKHTRVIVQLSGLSPKFEIRNSKQNQNSNSLQPKTLNLSPRATLYFNDMRVFGWMKYVTQEEWQDINSSLPPDVVDDTFTEDYFASQLARTRRPIKVALLEQSYFGGIGNIYANDALWKAEIDPHKPAQDLTKLEITKLYPAVISVINRSIELGGATESDYRHVDGLGGKYQDEFLTYKREGLPCLRCDGVIVKTKLGGRGTFYCEVCQN